MTYSLKSTVLAEVDLARFVPSEHPRLPGGHRGGGRFVSKTSTFGITLHNPDGSTTTRISGKHAQYRDPERAIAGTYTGLGEGPRIDYSQVQWDLLFHKMADENESRSSREAALKEVQVHLERMKRDTLEARTDIAVRKVASPTAQKVLKESTQAREYGADVTKDASRVAATQYLLQWATRAVGAAGAIIGVSEAEKLSEAFAKIAENPAIESGVNVALAMLIATLIAKIQHHFHEKHDRKVALARGELKQG